MRFQLSRNEESLRLVGTDMSAGHLPAKNAYDRIAPR